MGNNSVSTNPLGQFKDDVAGELKNVASDTAKQVLSEPKKILESILGGKPSLDKGDKGMETPTGGTQQQQQLLVKKQVEDKQKSQALISLHRQRMQEEVQHFERRKQEQETEEKQEEQEEKQEKQAKVVQLSREKAKSVQLGAQTYGRTGSHEQGDKRKG